MHSATAFWLVTAVHVIYFSLNAKNYISLRSSALYKLKKKRVLNAKQLTASHLFLHFCSGAPCGLSPARNLQIAQD